MYQFNSRHRITTDIGQSLDSEALMDEALSAYNESPNSSPPFLPASSPDDELREWLRAFMCRELPTLIEYALTGRNVRFSAGMELTLPALVQHDLSDAIRDALRLLETPAADFIRLYDDFRAPRGGVGLTPEEVMFIVRAGRLGADNATGNEKAFGHARRLAGVLQEGLALTAQLQRAGQVRPWDEYLQTRDGELRTAHARGLTAADVKGNPSQVTFALLSEASVSEAWVARSVLSEALTAGVARQRQRLNTIHGWAAAAAQHHSQGGFARAMEALYLPLSQLLNALEAEAVVVRPASLAGAKIKKDRALTDKVTGAVSETFKYLHAGGKSVAIGVKAELFKAAARAGGGLPSVLQGVQERDLRAEMLRTGVRLLDEIQQLGADIGQIHQAGITLSTLTSWRGRAEDVPDGGELDAPLLATVVLFRQKEEEALAALRQASEPASGARANALLSPLFGLLKETGDIEGRNSADGLEAVAKALDVMREDLSAVQKDAADVKKGGVRVAGRVREWLDLLELLKGEVKLRVAAALGTSPANFSRSGMLARSIAERVEADKAQWLAGRSGGASPEWQTHYDRMFEAMMTDYAPALGLKAVGEKELLAWLPLALKNAAAGRVLYPETMADIRAGAKSLEVTILDWSSRAAVRRLVRGACGAGFTLVPGLAALPAKLVVRIVLTSVRVALAARRGRRGIRVGEGDIADEVLAYAKGEYAKVAAKTLAGILPGVREVAGLVVMAADAYRVGTAATAKKAALTATVELPWVGVSRGMGAMLKAVDAVHISDADLSALLAEADVETEEKYDVHAALSAIAESTGDGPQPETAGLAATLLGVYLKQQAAGEPPLRMVRSASAQRSRYDYDRTGGFITLQSGADAQEVLHEVAHALTARRLDDALRNPNTAAGRLCVKLASLRAAAAESWREKGGEPAGLTYYLDGKENDALHEFVAGVYSDRALRAFLRDIDPEGNGLWTLLTTLLCELLGVEREALSALFAAERDSGALMDLALTEGAGDAEGTLYGASGIARFTEQDADVRSGVGISSPHVGERDGWKPVTAIDATDFDLPAGKLLEYVFSYVRDGQKVIKSGRVRMPADRLGNRRWHGYFSHKLKQIIYQDDSLTGVFDVKLRSEEGGELGAANIGSHYNAVYASTESLASAPDFKWKISDDLTESGTVPAEFWDNKMSVHTGMHRSNQVNAYDGWRPLTSLNNSDYHLPRGAKISYAFSYETTVKGHSQTVVKRGLITPVIRNNTYWHLNFAQQLKKIINSDSDLSGVFDVDMQNWRGWGGVDASHDNDVYVKKSQEKVFRNARFSWALVPKWASEANDPLFGHRGQLQGNAKPTQVAEYTSLASLGGADFDFPAHARVRVDFRIEKGGKYYAPWELIHIPEEYRKKGKWQGYMSREIQRIISDDADLKSRYAVKRRVGNVLQAPDDSQHNDVYRLTSSTDWQTRFGWSIERDPESVRRQGTLPLSAAHDLRLGESILITVRKGSDLVEHIRLIPPANRRGKTAWPIWAAEQINNSMKNVWAGSAYGSPPGSITENHLWVAQGSEAEWQVLREESPLPGQVSGSWHPCTADNGIPVALMFSRPPRPGEKLHVWVESKTSGEVVQSRSYALPAHSPGGEEKVMADIINRDDEAFFTAGVRSQNTFETTSVASGNRLWVMNDDHVVKYALVPKEADNVASTFMTQLMQYSPNNRSTPSTPLGKLMQSEADAFRFFLQKSPRLANLAGVATDEHDERHLLAASRRWYVRLSWPQRYQFDVATAFFWKLKTESGFRTRALHALPDALLRDHDSAIKAELRTRNGDDSYASRMDLFNRLNKTRSDLKVSEDIEVTSAQAMLQNDVSVTDDNKAAIARRDSLSAELDELLKKEHSEAAFLSKYTYLKEDKETPAPASAAADEVEAGRGISPTLESVVGEADNWIVASAHGQGLTIVKGDLNKVITITYRNAFSSIGEEFEEGSERMTLRDVLLGEFARKTDNTPEGVSIFNIRYACEENSTVADYLNRHHLQAEGMAGDLAIADRVQQKATAAFNQFACLPGVSAAFKKVAVGSVLSAIVREAGKLAGQDPVYEEIITHHLREVQKGGSYLQAVIFNGKTVPGLVAIGKGDFRIIFSLHKGEMFFFNARASDTRLTRLIKEHVAEVDRGTVTDDAVLPWYSATIDTYLGRQTRSHLKETRLSFSAAGGAFTVPQGARHTTVMEANIARARSELNGMIYSSEESQAKLADDRRESTLSFLKFTLGAMAFVVAAPAEMIALGGLIVLADRESVSGAQEAASRADRSAERMKAENNVRWGEINLYADAVLGVVRPVMSLAYGSAGVREFAEGAEMQMGRSAMPGSGAKSVDFNKYMARDASYMGFPRQGRHSWASEDLDPEGIYAAPSEVTEVEINGEALAPAGPVASKAAMFEGYRVLTVSETGLGSAHADASGMYTLTGRGVTRHYIKSGNRFYQVIYEPQDNVMRLYDGRQSFTSGYHRPIRLNSGGEWEFHAETGLAGGGLFDRLRKAPKPLIHPSRRDIEPLLESITSGDLDDAETTLAESTETLLKSQLGTNYNTYLISPKENCANAATEVYQAMKRSGYNDVKIHELGIWPNIGVDTMPANHFVVMAQKDGKDVVVDLTAGQFGMYGFSGPIISTKDGWLYQWQQAMKQKMRTLVKIAPLTGGIATSPFSLDYTNPQLYVPNGYLLHCPTSYINLVSTS